MSFATGGTHRSRITSTGQVAIGTDTASGYTDRMLTLYNPTTAYLEVRTNAGDNNSGIIFSKGAAQDADSYRGYIAYNHSTDYMTFHTGGGTRRGMFDANGLHFDTNNNSAATGLDDYEEGTWTPGIGGSSGGACTMGSGNLGRYVKVGAKVINTPEEIFKKSKCLIAVHCEDEEIIQKNIKTITSSSKNNIVVVKTTAISLQESNRNSALEGKLNNHFPDVSNLFKEIIKTLDNNGEELLADNILFRLDKLGLKSKNFVLEQRFLLADKVIKKYMWVTGGLIMVNPLPAIDFLTTTSVIIQLIIEISKIY